MIEQFENLLLSTKRGGIENLIEFIRKSDFYKAPASTRFHSCHEGGLLEHTLNVYKCLKNKENNTIWKDIFKDIPEESLIISALLHDLCKTHFYVVDYRNKKNNNGEWEKVPYYTVDDKIPYGHGEKSVMMIEEYIKLTPIEKYAIRWHMGWSEPKENYNTLGKAMGKYPLVLALHEADQEATYLLEEEE
jgi:hypothetical protein